MPDELAKGGSMDCARWLGVIFLVCGLAGCAGTGIKSNEEADAKIAVAKKAKSRWDALIKGDLAAAYEYLSPGTRSVLSLEAYKAKIRPGLWKRVSVDSVTCERSRCDVAIMLEYSYRDIKSIETRLIETWLHEGGWWYVPRK